ncbi:MAG: hypothetical protein BWZ08_00981 [candidate division BRC1 bacterium ADurb.BinA292]|nr:MAG: hypothetical protein BWZ08_00981 [candidate division BRC1 bacterium ADurb.BinA292]
MSVARIFWAWLALQLLLPAPGRAGTVWVEDFKQNHLGMDHEWEMPVVLLGQGSGRFESDGEIARLSLCSGTAFRVQVTTARTIPWDAGQSRLLQMRISRLSPEARIKVYALCDADGREPRLVLNHQNASEALSAQVLTVDLQDKIPAETRSLSLRLELDKSNLKADPRLVEVYIDWIKVGLPGAPDQVPGVPRSASTEADADSGDAEDAQWLQWSAPEGYDDNRYTLSISRDPLFGAACTTILDGIEATRHRLDAELGAGVWYWSVSATSTSGLSGDFLLNEATGKPFSITIPESEEKADAVYPHFNVRAGSQGFGSTIKFTDEPKIVEQARFVLAMGSDSYKFLLGADGEDVNYVTVYQDMSDEIRRKSHTLVELIENEPAYRTVLDLPFKYFAMWANAMDMRVTLGRGKYNAPEMESEYRQLYDLTRFLMQTYQGTGKVFLIGHWEGDNVLMGGNDLINGTPSDAMINDMRRWIANRQRAVEDGRNSLPDVTGVEVYNYAEINILTPVLEHNLPRMINAILSEVPVDLISYSAYNCMNHTDELPERAWQHFDYILEHARFTGAWKHGKPVFVGEYCLPITLNPARPVRNLAAIQSAASWGSPINLFWSAYSVHADGHSSLVEFDGEKNQDYWYLADFIARMHALKNATRTWLGRNPTEIEANYLALEFDRIATSDILARVIDSVEYRVMVEDERFLTEILDGCGIAADAAGQLKQELATRLKQGELTRFEALLEILDSAAFAQAVSEDDFASYLAQVMGEESASGDGKRSERFLEAMNSRSFIQKDLDPDLADRINAELRAKYRPMFSTWN